MDIELTEDEIATALLDAKIKKRTKLQYEENEKLRQQKAKEITRPFNADELIQFCRRFYIERFNKEFIIDESNELLVKELAKYFTNDASFNRSSFSLNKGLLLMGNVGSGKTALMSFFQKNKKRCYTIKSCNDVSNEYLIYKDEVEKIYSTPIEKPLADPSVFFQRSIGYCFDDLGTEENKNAFGNKKNVLADVLLAIYNKQNFSKTFQDQVESEPKHFNHFHVTTNLNDDEIESKYGSRIYSRISEMFNIFILNGKDRRLFL